MNKDPNKVIQLHQRDPIGALERLNRITGLQFSRWPESLLSSVEQQPQADLPQAERAQSDEGCRQLG